MEYEKLYKEALERAKELHEAGNALTKAQMEIVFPELKESDDERIRRNIIAVVEWNSELTQAQKAEIYAWLEKQKEQKPIFRVGDTIIAKDGTCIPKEPFRIERIEDDCYWDDDNSILICNQDDFQLVEQQPAEWSEDYRGEDLRTRFAFYTYKDEDDALYLSNVFVEETSRNKGFGTKILAAAEKVAETIGAINIRLKVKQNSPANAWYRKHGYGYMAFEGDYDWLEKTLEYLKPINPEWSEEDKKMLLSIINAFRNGTVSTIGQEQWLKSLPKRFNLQPKQEWSKEDEKNLYNVIEAIKYTYDVSEGSSGSRLITWLKSLRPQPHWKPSDVQMEALAWYSGNYDVPPTGDKAIKSLYEDLKAL